MSEYEIAFFIGLFGSVHCVGMCGPLAFAIPFGGTSRWVWALDKLVYQFGRVISYSILGLLVGFIGRQLWLFDLQNLISIVSGIFIMLASLARLFSFKLGSDLSLKLSSPFNKLLGYAVKHRAGHLLIGILNGLLPCGFVYLALIGAINTGKVSNAVLYMVYFGLGTIPLMLVATLSTRFFGISIRRKLNRAVPYFMLLLGIWFFLRGLALDIPYLSPAKAGTEVCH